MVSWLLLYERPREKRAKSFQGPVITVLEMKNVLLVGVWAGSK
jgi:hypothetical protein